MKKSRYKNIFFEYSLVDENHENHGALILFVGIPAIPKKYDILEKFKLKGFDVFCPRYEGTWESEGEFLRRNPVDGMNEFISSLSLGINLDNRIYSAKKIFILGSSFGGGIGLSVNENDYIKGVCVTSPVVSFKQVKRIETLGSYLKESLSEGYRFDDSNWKKLIEDKFFCPLTNTYLPSEKIMVVAGKDDDQIMVGDLREFCKDRKIRNFVIENFGHVTPSKINDELFSKILNFFMTK